LLDIAQQVQSAVARVAQEAPRDVVADLVQDDGIAPAVGVAAGRRCELDPAATVCGRSRSQRRTPVQEQGVGRPGYDVEEDTRAQRVPRIERDVENMEGLQPAEAVGIAPHQNTRIRAAGQKLEGFGDQLVRPGAFECAGSAVGEIENLEVVSGVGAGRREELQDDGARDRRQKVEAHLAGIADLSRREHAAARVGEHDRDAAQGQELRRAGIPSRIDAAVFVQHGGSQSSGCRGRARLRRMHRDARRTGRRPPGAGTQIEAAELGRELQADFDVHEGGIDAQSAAALFAGVQRRVGKRCRERARRRPHLPRHSAQRDVTPRRERPRERRACELEAQIEGGFGRRRHRGRRDAHPQRHDPAAAACTA
jgi:hypothetical protein